MGKKKLKSLNQNFFKTWTHKMSYVLGYVAADGCIMMRKDRTNNPYIFNITSADRDHLHCLRRVMGSGHTIGEKSNGHGTSIAYQLSISNKTLTSDLMKRGITPRKTHTLQYIHVPDEYFADFVRGFFDGDGSVYLYEVNGTMQIKAGFTCVSRPFIEKFNWRLCSHLGIPVKSLHKDDKRRGGRVAQYSICFYIDDCERLARFMYNGASLYLKRKYRIFKQWERIARRHYKKHAYPSKIGWRLSEGFTYAV